jgi:hypothetical protein
MTIVIRNNYLILWKKMLNVFLNSILMILHKMFLMILLVVVIFMLIRRTILTL